MSGYPGVKQIFLKKILCEIGAGCTVLMAARDLFQHIKNMLCLVA